MGDDDAAAAVIKVIRSCVPEDQLLEYLNKVLNRTKTRASNLEVGVDGTQDGTMVDGVVPYYTPDYRTR